MSAFNLKSGNATPFKLMGSSPAKTTHPISPSEKQDIRDVKVIEKATDSTKAGGKGSRIKDQPIVIKSKRRQIIRDKSELSRKELLKSSKQAHLASGGKGGSKSTVTGGRSRLKRIFASTKKLRSEDTVRQLRTASAKGQTSKRGEGVTEWAQELDIGSSPAKLALKRAKRPKKKDEVKTIQIPKEHIVQGKKNPMGGPVLKSPSEGGPKPGKGMIWNKKIEKQMKESFSSPMKQTTDRETMRAAAREKNKNISRKESIKSRKKEETLRHFVTKGTQKKGSLPRVPTEGGLAHNIRKTATWMGVASEKAKDMYKKEPRRSPSR